MIIPDQGWRFTVADLVTAPIPGDVISRDGVSYLVVSVDLDSNKSTTVAWVFPLAATVDFYPVVAGYSRTGGIMVDASPESLKASVDIQSVSEDTADGSLLELRTFIIQKPAGIVSDNCRIGFGGLISDMENIQPIRATTGEIIAWRLSGV